MSLDDWRKTRVAADKSHHTIDGLSFYSQRFKQVLKFHAPGLAPVVDDSGAYHIDMQAKAAYPHRHRRTFGFYEGLAAVDGDGGWHHVDPSGAPLYATRYAWCGNFQGGRCTVRQPDGLYLHICADGSPAYASRWRYAGDFRGGIAVVQGDDGRSTHIDTSGRPIHDHAFFDLDVFHKGFARARDEGGWTHVDTHGIPLYNQRFAMTEPFYNGQARVETHDGQMLVIDEGGDTLTELRPPRQSPLQSLSSDLVGFWRTQTLFTAVSLGVIDALPGDTSSVATRTGLPQDSARRLLRALSELGIVTVGPSAVWSPTEKGRLLKAGQGMDAAAKVWGLDHSRQWFKLGEVLSTGEGPQEPRPSYFQSLSADEVATYHRAMEAYARHDYADIPPQLDLSRHHQIIDAGGGTGALLTLLLSAAPHLRGTLFDRPEVIAHGGLPAALRSRANLTSGDLFEPWPAKGDAIFLARVLHDWGDDDAGRILARAKEALLPGGALYIVEMILPDHGPGGGLLDLNMAVMTGGRERTKGDWCQLLGSAGFALKRIIPLETTPDIIVAGGASP